MEEQKSYFDEIGAYGQLIIISGPKGVGKRAVIKEYLAQHPVATRCPVVTTRKPKEGETSNENYTFVSPREFERLVRTHQILDYTYYWRTGFGTTCESIDAARAAGRNVILMEDVARTMRLKAHYEDATTIFFLSPTWEDLEKNIRAEESEEPVEDRLFRAQEQILGADQFDYILINDTLEKSVRRLGQIIHGNRFSKRMMTRFLESYIESEINYDLIVELE